MTDAQRAEAENILGGMLADLRELVDELGGNYGRMSYYGGHWMQATVRDSDGVCADVMVSLGGEDE